MTGRRHPTTPGTSSDRFTRTAVIGRLTRRVTGVTLPRRMADVARIGDHFRYLVAATANVKGYEPATLNVKHFPMFKNLLPPFGASTN